MTKVGLPLLSQVALGVVAGGFLGLGAMLLTLAVSDTNLRFTLGCAASCAGTGVQLPFAAKRYS